MGHRGLVVLHWLGIQEVPGLNPVLGILCEDRNLQKKDCISSLLSMALTLKSTWATLEGHK